MILCLVVASRQVAIAIPYDNRFGLCPAAKKTDDVDLLCEKTLLFFF